VTLRGFPWWILATVPLAALWAACQVYPTTTTSSFDLEGAHLDLTCSDCHGTDLDTPPPTKCSGCHDGDLPPVHWVEEDCGECHGQERWDDLEFEHEEWPLTGAHLETPCEDCHTDGSFEAEESCLVCHAEDKPAGHTDDDCWHCHGTVDWVPLFAHAGFPLVGGHSGVPCIRCHADGYHDVPHECVACHLDDKPGNHGSGNNNCEQCHDVYGW